MLNINSKSLKDIHINMNNNMFGLWVYLMSDCVFFSVLFIIYILSYNNMLNTVNSSFYNIPFVLVETLILLISSYTCCLINYYFSINKIKYMFYCLLITFLLGISFIYMEIYEFIHLIKNNFGPDKNYFLSSFFTLLGIHGIHIIVGLIWFIILMLQIYLNKFDKIKNNLYCLSLFWHFLDIIWVFIFTIVYLFSFITVKH
ncbi:MAG: cytochrome c oxidase subunit 3 [Candidatus Lightella neohaematopini]|nr:cytochrome c oxidase subunit 3 [Candidatus Lightella neohaematopini]MCV2528921.1 cytochrome c oxidase subunit 3 [Candidatus Lightella neohaematopini]